MSKPNILYIHSHDTGRYIQPYGHQVHTPNLQKLAEEGVLFRQNFCVNPTCSASRACLLTGRYAHSNGMIGLAHRGFSLNNYGHHMVHTLRKHGYTSALSGIQHIAHGKDAWKTIGYDRCLGGHEEAHTQAVEYLDHAPKEPFFLSVGFFETHRAFPTENPDDNADYCLPPAPLPDTPEIREDMNRFKASARSLDRKVGEVFDALERNGLAENTLVICTTDHGIAFPRMKCNLQDSGTGVMLIMRGPGGFTGGRVLDGMTSHVDIFPTLCEVLDIEKPDWLQGQSFLPMVKGQTSEGREEVFTEVNYHAAYEPMRSVRTKRYKYIRRFDPRTAPVLPNCDSGLSKDVWLADGWQGMAPENEYLFDLTFDPNEANNLAGNPEMKDVLEEMRQRVVRWMKDTDDMLLEGKIDAPKGALVNDVDGMHPGDTPLVVE